MRDPYAKSRQAFERETPNHELTILRDDGVYRHLRCKAPDSGLYWFDVVTWPGHLYVGGDIDSYTFARVHDMFEFFGNGEKYSYGINPDYWSQKLTMLEQLRQRGRVYSEDAFWARILEWARVELEEYGLDEHIYPSLLIGALEREVRINDWYAGPHLPTHEAEARELLDDFHWLFGETWEWNLQEDDPCFLRACWAIVWAIEQYEKTIAATPTQPTKETCTREQLLSDEAAERAARERWMRELKAGVEAEVRLLNSNLGEQGFASSATRLTALLNPSNLSLAETEPKETDETLGKGPCETCGGRQIVIQDVQHGSNVMPCPTCTTEKQGEAEER